jgi:hypothetical protein
LSKRPLKPVMRISRDAPLARVRDVLTTNGPRWRYGQLRPPQRTMIVTPAGAVTAKSRSLTPRVE